MKKIISLFKPKRDDDDQYLYEMPMVPRARENSISSSVLPRGNMDDQLVVGKIYPSVSQEQLYEEVAKILDMRVEVEAKLRSPHNINFRHIRCMLQGFDAFYSGSQRWKGLVKVMLSMCLLGDMEKMGDIFSSMLMRNYRFIWKDGKGPLHGESLRYTQEYDWKYNMENVILTYQVRVVPSISPGGCWSKDSEGMLATLWNDMRLKADRDQELSHVLILKE
uniref:Matrix protein n=1 Tax=Frog lyssa-like virus 1 TaxID=2571313 RepID=A0A6G5RT96_9RHAB|nr:matrix protein [Frog lyssa-like virus 1]